MNTVRSGERREAAARASEALVPAVATACRILDALATLRPTGATLSELARTLGLSKSTMHSQLTTLSAHGMVERDEATRRFRLGPALVALGAAAAVPEGLAALAAERLPTLAGEHHLTFTLAVVDEPGDAHLTERAYPLRAVHVGLALGTRYGVGDGAIGKCLLAAMSPADAARAIRERPLLRHTERTTVDPEALLAEAAIVRRRGWAASAGELKDNHAVAVSVRGRSGKPDLILCAVSFPGELPESRFPSVGDALRESAREIEIAAGFAPTPEAAPDPSTRRLPQEAT